MSVPFDPSHFQFVKPERFVDETFIHCSASDNPAHDSVAVMRAWHLAREWSDVGYHFFIRKNGKLEIGRPIEKTPAAQGGHNRNTIAICLHGLDESKFTAAQFATLIALCRQIDEAYNGRMRFRGHKEVAAKACPVFDYRDVLQLDDGGDLSVSSGGKLRLAIPRGIEKLEEAEAAIPSRPPLRRGASGTYVRILQKELTALGYHVGRIDGDFGKRTRAAVLAFQADNDLIEDGIVGPATYEALLDAQPREVGPERASATVFGLAGDGSRIARASIAQGVIGTGVVGGGVLQAVQSASDTVEEITDAFGPFEAALQSLGPWIGGAICAAGAIIVWQAIKAGRARAEDHRIGKTA